MSGIHHEQRLSESVQPGTLGPWLKAGYKVFVIGLRETIADNMRTGQAALRAGPHLIVATLEVTRILN